MANIKAEPKHMDEIDYYLNELNSDDNDKVNVTKAQIKAYINNLKESVNELKVEIKILLEDIYNAKFSYESYYDSNNEIKYLLDEYYSIKAKHFIWLQYKNNEGGEK